MRIISVHVKTSFSIAVDAPQSSIITLAAQEGTKESIYIFRSEYSPLEEDLLAVGRDITPEEQQALLGAAQSYRAEQAALRLAARAEQATRVLIRKLRLKGFPPASAEAAVSYLAAQGIVNDARYARLYLEYQVAHGSHSPRSLRQTLYQRGIPRDSVAEALDSALRTEEGTTAELALLEKFLKKYGMKGAKSQSDVVRRLRAEGFSREAIDEYFQE